MKETLTTSETKKIKSAILPIMKNRFLNSKPKVLHTPPLVSKLGSAPTKETSFRRLKLNTKVTRRLIEK
jgi:hypothetical protein